MKVNVACLTAISTLMALVAGCVTPSASQTAESLGPITSISVGRWTFVSEGKNVVELGCVCEGDNDKWQLYRYASADQDVYKIALFVQTSLNACVKAKFDGTNCKLKF